MPGNRFEKLAQTYLHGRLNETEELEFLQLLDEPENQERFVLNELVGRTLHESGKGNQIQTAQRVLDVISTSKPHFAERVIERILTEHGQPAEQETVEAEQQIVEAAPEAPQQSRPVRFPSRAQEKTISLRLPPKKGSTAPFGARSNGRKRPRRSSQVSSKQATIPFFQRQSVVAMAAAFVILMTIAGMFGLFQQFTARPNVNHGMVAMIDSLEGQVMRISAEGETNRLVYGDYIREGDQLITSGSGRVEFSYIHDEAGSTTVSLAPESRLTVDTGQPGKLLHLTNGVMSANVARQNAAHPMVIETPHAEATVLGTRFTLMTDTEKTRLEVSKGRVRMALKDGTQSTIVSSSSFAESRLMLSETLNLSHGSITDPKAADILHFTLYNASNGQPVAGFNPVPEGATFDIPSLNLHQMEIQANMRNVTDGSLQIALLDNSGSMLLELTSNFNEKHGEPKKRSFINDGNAQEGLEWLPEGQYVLRALPYSGPNLTGSSGEMASLTFRIQR